MSAKAPRSLTGAWYYIKLRTSINQASLINLGAICETTLREAPRSIKGVIGGAHLPGLPRYVYAF